MKTLWVNDDIGNDMVPINPVTGKPGKRIQVKDPYKVPNGSPDMGGVTVDGTQLWLSVRHHNEVYVIDTGTGALIKRIAVKRGPHGLLVWPQPGSFSLGHTGNVR